jgi:glycosyltransferase involved in cell wall biosynthesis
MQLTVAIPTFNRNAILRANLERLVPQLDADCRLLILDNCSPTPVADTISDILRESRAPVTLVRHRVNIGGNANVLRTFELCESDWIWVLGDDDAPHPDAVATIKRNITEHPTSRFFNYSTELFARSRTTVTRGPVELIDRAESFSNTLFLSTDVFDARVIQAQLRVAYLYAYSNAPHLIALLASLGTDDVCVLSHERIVSWEAPPHAERWSMINAGLSFPTILDAPLPVAIRDALGRLVWDAYPPLEGLVRQLLMLARHDGSAREARFLYSQLVARRYSGVRKSWGWVRSVLYRPLFWVPAVSAPVVELASRAMLGDAAGENRLQDRVARM